MQLEQQYRMNQEIMSLSSALVYNNRLRCGSPEVASRKLILSYAPQAHSHAHAATPPPEYTTFFGSSIPSQKMEAWVAAAINPELPVVFLDTDEV